MRAHWMEPVEAECDVESLRGEGIGCDVFALAEIEATVQRAKAEGPFAHDSIHSLGGPRAEAQRAREADEHTHNADEIRLFASGRGLYDVRARDDRWIRVWVEAGDMIVVPRHRYHRFLVVEGEVTWRELFSGPGDLMQLFRGSDDSTRVG